MVVAGQPLRMNFRVVEGESKFLLKFNFSSPDACVGCSLLSHNRDNRA